MSSVVLALDLQVDPLAGRQAAHDVGDEPGRDGQRALGLDLAGHPGGDADLEVRGGQAQAAVLGPEEDVREDGQAGAAAHGAADEGEAARQVLLHQGQLHERWSSFGAGRGSLLSSHLIIIFMVWNVWTIRPPPRGRSSTTRTVAHDPDRRWPDGGGPRPGLWMSQDAVHDRHRRPPARPRPPSRPPGWRPRPINRPSTAADPARFGSDDVSRADSGQPEAQVGIGLDGATAGPCARPPHSSGRDSTRWIRSDPVECMPGSKAVSPTRPPVPDRGVRPARPVNCRAERP